MYHTSQYNTGVIIDYTIKIYAFAWCPPHLKNRGISLATLVQQRLTHLPTQKSESSPHPICLTPDRDAIGAL